MLLYRLRNRHILLFDAALLAVIPTLALAVRKDLVVSAGQVPALVALTLLGLGIKLPLFYAFGLYNRLWRYASLEELNTILVAVSTSAVLVAGVFFAGLATGVIPAVGFPRSVPLIDAGLTLLAAGGVRFGIRMAEQRQARHAGGARPRRVLIVGAGDAGSMLAKELRARPAAGLDPIGFVDDDPRKQGLPIHDVPVLGPRARLAELVRAHQAQEVLIAMPSAPGKVIREIVAACLAAGVPSRTLPSLVELASGQASASRLRAVQVEDLLRREAVHTDLAAVQGMLAGKRVLVTGAGGSIGAELCRQIARCAPAQLIALGHGENSLFELANDLCRRGSDGLPGPYQLQTVVADIRDRDRLAAVFGRLRPQVVFHAAAHKHVPLMESNVEDAVSNNVLGTRNVVELAEQYGAERFVLISSDKAVNPCSVMGVTKRVAELLVAQAAERCRRPFVSVRFGNVLGSRGSVLPVLRQQIADGGPVTLTHPDMRRYFMTIPEAVQLVLQAAVLGQAGRVFVLDMGQPVRLVDLAHDLIRLSGLEVGRDIDIIFTGPRPGEKLFEELFGGLEQHACTEHAKIFVAANGHHAGSPLSLAEQVDRLAAAAAAGHADEARLWLQRIVPEYVPASAPPALAAVPPADTQAPPAAPVPVGMPNPLPLRQPSGD